MNNKDYYVYIIRTNKNTLYTGITTDMQRRFYEHLCDKTKGAKYTKIHKVVKIELLLKTLGRSNASKIENYIKTFSKIQKENFIKNKKKLVEIILKEKNIECILCDNI